MKIKSSVLFGLVVLICLVGGISLMNRMNDDQGGWRPADMYSTYGGSQGSTYSSVSYGSASSADLSVPMLSSSNSLFRRRGAFSYAPASSVGTASYSQSPIAYNQGLHTTSSAEFRSFGGGGNVGAVSMSGGAIKSSSFSSTAPASVLSVSMPTAPAFAYNRGALSSVSGDIAMASTQAYAGIGNTTGGAMGGISGRKNGAAEDSWLQWLARYGSGFGTVSGDEENGWTYSFDYYQLDKAYQDYVNNYWDDMWGEPPTFAQWLAWFQSNGGSHDYRGNTYNWVPVGDYYPLLILAMLYVGYVAIRRRKSKISENNI